MTVRSMFVTSIVLAAVCGVGCQHRADATEGTDPGCSKDADCKGDRICTHHECGPPSITDTPACPPCTACPDCPTTTVTSAAPSASNGPKGAVTDAEKARALLLENPQQAKFILYNRLTGKAGTREEYQVLREACRAPASYDKACIEQCSKHLATQ